MFESFVCNNGLRVLLCQKPHTNRVRAQILYHFGSGVEQSDEERGLAHVVEHMIFKGTHRSLVFSNTDVEPVVSIDSETITRDELEKVVKEKCGDQAASALAKLHALYLSESDIDSIGRMYGASLNAYTSLEKTSYFFETGKGNILPFLQIFANSAVHSSFKDEHINSEIKAVLQEMKMGNDNHIRMAIQKSMEMLYSVHERGHLSTIGSESQLMKLNSDVVQRFYRKHYHPWNATLFLVGDFDIPTYKQHIVQLFDSIGKENWEAKQKVDELGTRIYQKERSPNLQDEITQVMTHVDGLTNAPFRKILLNKCKEYANAISNHSTLQPEALEHVMPPPTTVKATQYENVSTPTWIYSWRIPGSQIISPEHARAFSIICSHGSLSRFQQKMVQTGLVADVSIFADQYQKLGSLFVLVCPFAHTNRTDTEKILFETLQSEITEKEWQKAINIIHTEHTLLHENVGGFTNEWVQQISIGQGANHIFDPPVLKQLHVSTLQKHLDQPPKATVDVCPIPDGPLKTQWQERKQLRERNAQKIIQIKNRVTDIDPPHSLHLMPPAQHISDILMPSVVESPFTQLHHPTSHMFHASITPQYKHHHALHYTLDGMTYAMAMKCAARRHQNMDQHGALYSISSAGAFLTMPFDSPARDECFKQFLSKNHHIHLQDDPQTLVHVKKQMMEDIVQQKEDASANALHCLTNHFMRSVPYSYDDALQHLQSCTFQDLQESSWRFGDLAHILVMSPGEGQTPQKVGEYTHTTTIHESVSEEPQHIHIPMERNQTVVALARTGQVLAKNPFNYMLVHDLLYHICFYSLGSRAYKIRERTGLFYGCQAQLGVGATHTETGFDYVITKVEPTDVERVQTEFKQLFTQMHTEPNIKHNELDAAKRWFENLWVQRIADIGACAATIHTVQRMYPGEDWQTLPMRLVQAANQVTLEQMNELAKQTFAAPWNVHITVG